MRATLPLLVLLPTLGCRTAQPVPSTPSRDLTADFVLRDDLAVTLWAESPDLYNPTAIEVDERGRIWVTEAVNYRQWRGRNPGRHHAGGDRVVVLEDSDGDGACDTSRVFVQDPDLVSPLGIAVVGKRVIVSCSPSVFVYTDEDEDGVADKRETLLSGFGGANHDHGIHSAVVGPDGRYWFAAGNAGPHVVTDRAGWTLRAGSIYREGGEHASDNAPHLASDDGRTHVGGLILRVEPDGSGLEVVAHNFRNPYEVALDSFGNPFTVDNDDDGNEACRATFVLEGGDYGYTSVGGSRTWMADRRPSQSVQTAHWHQDDPGVVPGGRIHGAGGPTGVVVYEGDLFGPELDGAMLDADAGRNCVFVDRPVARGARFDFETSTLIAARTGGEEERARWFRPSDVAVAPDGSIFVADWYDPGVGGHAMGDREAYGRILRIAPRGVRTSTPELDLATVGGAIDALRSPAVHVRALAAESLRARGEAAVPELAARFAGTRDARMQARLAWLLAGFDAGVRVLANAKDRLADDVLVTVLRARASAARRERWSEHRPTLAESRGEGTVLDTVGEVVPDGIENRSPAIRREIALALSEWPFDESVPRLTKLGRAYDGNDRTYLEAFGIACESKEALVLALLRDEEGSDPLRWSQAFADIAWRLHPEFALPDFVARVRSEELSLAERRQSLDAIAFIATRAAAEAMLDLALAGPEALRETALAWIENRDTNTWREYDVAEQLGPRGIAAAETRWRSGVITRGAIEVDVDVSGARTIWLVATEGERGPGHDWADWIAPRLIGPEDELALADLPWRHAEAGWGPVTRNANPLGDPLSIDGRTYEEGIAAHAYSEIEFEVPPGFTRFQALAGIDDGGSRQVNARPDVEFAVLVDAPRDPQTLHMVAVALTDEGASDEDIEEAADELASSREGGLAILRLAAAGKLSGRARLVVAKAIFTCPDLAVRALALESFAPPAPPASRGPRPDAAEVLALEGDPRRGQTIYFGEAASCSSCHTFEGRGGEIGPDLSSIRTKYGPAEILDAILEPSRALAFGYEAWTIETDDGVLRSGFVLSEGDDVVIKDTAGRRHVIPASEIVARTKQRLSTMPDDVALGLDARALADLVAFLSTDRTAPGRPLATRALFDGRDLSGWTHHLADPAARAEDVWSIADGVLRCRGTPAGYLRTVEDFTSFVLELEWRFDPELPPGNSGVLLRLHGPDKVWPKSIEAQLQHRHAGDIWNIDGFDMQAEAARTDGRHTEKEQPSNERPLGEWNRYRITLDGGELTLEVNGVVQNRARWCAEVPGKIGLQSEGSVIEFRDVRITPLERTPPGR